MQKAQFDARVNAGRASPVEAPAPALIPGLDAPAPVGVTLLKWTQLQERGTEAGLYKPGMTKQQLIKLMLDAGVNPYVDDEAAPPIPAYQRELLIEALEAMPLHELWKEAEKRGVKFADVRKSDIIDNVIAHDERIAERERAKQAALLAQATAQEPIAAPPIPVDPAVNEDGTVEFSLAELAILFAVALPGDTKIDVMMGHVESYARFARRREPDVVIYSRKDVNGHNRRFRIKLPESLFLEVTEET